MDATVWRWLHGIFSARYNCLFNLNRVLHRCEDEHLFINREKCHFMVTEGVIFGHRVSGREIEVGRAKIKAIETLPYPKILKV
jgi:hypothetical protein